MRLWLMAASAAALVGCGRPAPVKIPLLAPKAAASVPVTDSCVWIDRFGNPGQSELGSYWYSYTDAGNQGRSKISPTPPGAGVHEKGNLRWLQQDYTLDQGVFQWNPYVAFGVELNAVPLPWDSIAGIAYDYRGTNHLLIWKLGTVTDYANYQKQMPRSTDWTTAVIPFKMLRQPAMWGTKVPWDPNQTQAVDWQVTGATGMKGSLEIANVRLVRKGAAGVALPPVYEQAKSKYSTPQTKSAIDSSAWMAQAKVGQVRALPWRGGAKGAFSLSFDDGMISQVQHAVPILDQHQFKATFFPITSALAEKGKEPDWYFGTWEAFLALGQAGHELGSHTVNHPHLAQMLAGSPRDANTIENELWNAALTLEQKTGKPVRSFAYPFGEYDDRVLRAVGQLHLVGRGVSGLANTSSANLLAMDASSFSYGPGRTLESDLAQVDQWKAKVQAQVIDRGAWGMWYAHDVLPFAQAVARKDSWHPVSSEAFARLCDFLSAAQQKGDLWVAPMGVIVQYHNSALALKAGVLEATDRRLGIQLADGLPNDLYSEALDLEIKVPTDWKFVNYDGERIAVQGGLVRLSALPDAKIVLTRVP
jgi:peptidoglycan/xylan/chitin deacetylase (PgdA/CDA1 family)